jgi:hypothetical protein
MSKLIAIIAAVIAMMGLWRTFEKAGKPGWLSLIPFLNFYLLIEIAGKPWWYFLLLFIPIVGLIVYAMILIAIAHNFKEETLFAVGLFLLPFIFWPILGFGPADFKPLAEFEPVRE